jgi:hypothetical protein
MNDGNECFNVPKAPPAPPLADPEWIAGFRDLVAEALKAAKYLQVIKPTTRDHLAFETAARWQPACNSLRDQLRCVVEDAEAFASGPLPRTRVYAVDRDVEAAYQLVCLALDRIGSPPGRFPLGKLRHAYELLSNRPAGATATPSVPPSNEEGGSEQDCETPAPDWVDLDQAAAMVHRTKSALEARKARRSRPPPTVKGYPGQPNLWEWGVLRPWLTETFGVPLPERYPGNRREP